MKETLKVVSNIDFALLKQQKQLLIETIKSIEEEAENFGDDAQDKLDALNGILNMIDSIQDAIVRDGFKKEKEVFNTTDDEEEVWYVNYYQCPNCAVRWDDRWTSMSDDTCPNCDCGNISPYKSESE